MGDSASWRRECTLSAARRLVGEVGDTTVMQTPSIEGARGWFHIRHRLPVLPRTAAMELTKKASHRGSAVRSATESCARVLVLRGGNIRRHGNAETCMTLLGIAFHPSDPCATLSRGGPLASRALSSFCAGKAWFRLASGAATPSFGIRRV